MNLTYKINIIFITHRVHSLKKVQNIFVLDEGRIIEEGNNDDLLNKNGRYKNLHDLNSF